MESIHERKSRHFNFFKDKKHLKAGNTLFDEIFIEHSPFSSISYGDLDCSTDFFGKSIDFPFMISSITGGFPTGEKFNNAIGKIAEKYNIPLCTGSIRPLFETPDSFNSFNLRERFNIPFFGLNISAVQALQFGADTLNETVLKLKGDALFLHFNRIQELAQPTGDRRFIFNEKLKSLISSLTIPVIFKETGLGIGKIAAMQAKEYGVDGIETAGAGGTSFLEVEMENMPPQKKEFWYDFLNLGIPSAPSIILAKSSNLPIIGSGGVRSGFDIAKCLIIGADISGIAAPFVTTWLNAGNNGLHNMMENYIKGIKTTMMLTGADTVNRLKSVNYTHGNNITSWIHSR